MFERVISWYMGQVGYLLSKLQAVSEPDGNTLLDNSMVLCGSGMGDGHWHRRTHLPTLLAGRGGGTIRSGRMIQNETRVDLSAVHTAILQRMGLPIPGFGTADGPLASLS